MEARLKGNFSVKLLVKGLLLFVMMGLVSCQENDQIGLEITPPGERFDYHIDSSAIIRVNTLRQDSLSTAKRDRSLLGSMNDPVFGRTSAGILTQLRLSSNEVDFGDEVQLDSVILILKYQNGYGDTTGMQHARIYELTESLYFDSVYYSNLDVTDYYDESGLLADFQFEPTPSADSLAIRMDDIAGEKVLFAEPASLEDNTAFLEYFKGLYIKPSPVNGEGSIMYFNLAGGESRMTIYYRNAEEDSLSYDVIINSNCTYLNHFEHDYSGAEAETFINDSAADAGMAYIQTMAGLRAHALIEFSDTLMERSYDGIAINKAELVIPVAREYINDSKPVPGSIQVFNALENGNNGYISDIYIGEEYYGGYYDEDSGTYTFNIARYVQNLLDPDLDFRLKNTGLFLIIKDSWTTAGQVVVKNDPRGERLRLNVTYTVFDK